MNKARIVIIGAGYAGIMTALRLAGQDRNQRADVTLINASDLFYERVRMHQVATNQTNAAHPIRNLLGKRPITFIQGWVRALDLERQIVQVDGQGEIGYDYLVYTLGSIPAQVKLPGVREYLYGIGNPKQAAALRERLLGQRPGDRVAVVGGGLTGIETSTEIAEAYPELHVHLITAGTPGQGLSQAGQAYLTRSFAEMGVAVHDHTQVAQVEADALVTESGERIPFVVGIWAGSFEAAPLAREAGLAVNAKGQMRIDRYMRSISHPAVYGAGDGAAPVEDPGAPLRMACAVALPMAAHTADNLLALLEGRPQQPFNFGYVVQCVSLGRQRGLLQFVNPDDSPRERIVTGRMGAIAKEMIVQYAYRSLPTERILPGAQVWLGKGKLPAGVEESALPQDAKPVHS